MINVLFVCLGNICRSPAAAAIFTHQSKNYPLLNFHFDSCGMGDWHLGHLPDERMRAAALRRGVCLTGQAKIFQKEYFSQFSYILAADHEIKNNLLQRAQSLKDKSKIFLITDFGLRYVGIEVPDPYYEPNHKFDLVLDILEDAAEGFFLHCSQNLIDNHT